MGMITDWPTLAACQNGDPDALFVQGAEQNVAKRICRSCPVRYECLADALDNRIEFGVWGGMTERERRALAAAPPAGGELAQDVRGRAAQQGQVAGHGWLIAEPIVRSPSMSWTSAGCAVTATVGTSGNSRANPAVTARSRSASAASAAWMRSASAVGACSPGSASVGRGGQAGLGAQLRHLGACARG